MATKLLKLLIATILVALSTSTFAQKGLSMGAADGRYLPETTGQKFRRLLAKADRTNALDAPILVGGIPYAASTTFNAGAVVSVGGNAYVETASPTGTTGSSSAPSGRGVGQSDGTCIWDYIGPQTAPQITLQTTAPSYLANNVIAYNDARIKYIGSAQPLDTGGSYYLPNVTCGPGGKGNCLGPSAGSALTNGWQCTHFCESICTDAPVVDFVTSNSNYPCNFLVDQNGIKAWALPMPLNG